MKLKFGTAKKNIVFFFKKQREKTICPKIEFNEKFSFGTDKKEKLYTEFYYEVLKPEFYANADKIVIKIEHENPIDFDKWSKILMRKELACQALSITENQVNENLENVVSYMEALNPINKTTYDSL